MERRRDGAATSPQRRGNNYASFSSTLLDAIYRSIDETDDGVEANLRRDGVEANLRRDGEGPDPRKKPSDASSVRRIIPEMTQVEVTRPTGEHWTRKNASSVTRSGRDQRRTATPTSSSSDASSYGGFSSSEAESVTASQPARNRPIGTTAAGSSSFPARSGRGRPSTVPPPPPPAASSGDEKRRKKERHGSIGNRLMRELWRGRSPASPGFRFANFLNSLFTSKSKVSGNATTAGEESACSTASSFSRSCLNKTRGKTGPPKRTVKFSPTSVIVDGGRGHRDEKTVGGNNRPSLPEGATAGTAKQTLRRRRMDEKEEEGESDSSSDLFELENMAVMGRFQDELPVYETTNLASYSGNSRFLS